VPPRMLHCDHNHDREIVLARTATPEAISCDAEIVVLGQHGYETTVKGKNGFVCHVERSWMAPFDNNPEFWNPKMRGAGCCNPQAARSALRDFGYTYGNWVYTSKDKEVGKTAVSYGRFTTIWKTEGRAVEGSRQHNKFQSSPQS
jgi:hypothetical protein